MDIQQGDRVRVNIAPFIGSCRRGSNSICCRVMSVRENAVEVSTEYPHRQFSMWVEPNWIEGPAGSDSRPPREDVHQPLCA
jgi:hypothetical protein